MLFPTYSKMYMEHPDAPLFEGVLRPAKYVWVLTQKLKENRKNFFNTDYTNIILCKKLSELFKNEKIIFTWGDKDEIDGIYKSGFNFETQEIFMYCDNSFKDLQKSEADFQLFSIDFKDFLGHEIIHRLQFIKDSSIHLKNYSSDDLVSYLSNKKEIMSYAWNTVETFKMMYLGRDAIYFALKNKDKSKPAMHNIFLRLYTQTFLPNSNVLKLYYKYIYMYLDE